MLMCRIQVSHSKILSSKKWKGYKTRALYLVYFTHTMSVINGILTQGEGRDWTWTLQQSFSGFVKMKTEKRDAIFQDILSTLGISDDCCMRIVEEEKQEIWWIFFFFLFVDESFVNCYTILMKYESPAVSNSTMSSSRTKFPLPHS